MLTFLRDYDLLNLDDYVPPAQPRQGRVDGLWVFGPTQGKKTGITSGWNAGTEIR